MTTFTIKPEKTNVITWFKDSPDVGTPECVCSYCAKGIAEGDLPLRVFRSEDDTELRLHIMCAQEVILELSPGKSESRHRNHPAFAEGQEAYKGGMRRGGNPYPTGAARLAWWAGWDDRWEDEYANPSHLAL